MGQTSIYGFPYPEITDNANVPNDIKILAEKVEEIVESTSYDMFKENAGNVANTYGLIAEYNISALYDDFSDTIILNRSMGNYDGNLSSVIVNVVGRFDDGNLLNCSVNYLTREMEEVKVIAITNIINDVANIKLYVKSIAQYTIISAKSLDYKKTGNITRQYYKDQPNITVLPSGIQVLGKDLEQPYLLYDNWNGTNGTVNLNQDRSNFDRIVIHYRNDDWQTSSVEIKSADTTTYGAIIRKNSDDTCIMINSALFILLGNVITMSRNSQANIYFSGGGNSDSNQIYIQSVYGYK